MALIGPDNRVHMYRQGAQIGLNSAIYHFVTPPRKPIVKNKRLSPTLAVIKDAYKDQSKPESERSSPSAEYGFYAGAKFGEKPHPTELPPRSWFENRKSAASDPSCAELTNNLKVLLNVKVQS